MKTIKTYQDAIINGYQLGDKTTFKGYISRRMDTDAAPIHVAGGKRKGQLYVELPNYDSSWYSYRQYLVLKQD